MDILQPIEVEDVTKRLEQLNAKNKSLHRVVDELSLLNEFSLSISGTVDSDKIMNTNTTIDRSICFYGRRGR